MTQAFTPPAVALILRRLGHGERVEALVGMTG